MQWALTQLKSTVYGSVMMLCASLACAQALDPVFVETEPTTDVGEVEHSEFTGSYSHISAADLTQGAESMAAVIARESGIQYRQAGSLGSFSSITIRGATSAQTDVFLDGVLLNNAGNGTVDLSQFELLNVGSIDVYRGTTPIQLGTGNLGGAVNLRTPDVVDNQIRVLVGVGSFNEQKAQVALQGAKGNGDFRLALNHHSSDNTFSFTNDNGTPLNPADDTVQRRINSDFERNALLFKYRHRINEFRRLNVLMQHNDRKQGIPHWRNIEQASTRYDTESSQVQLSQQVSSRSDVGWNHSQTIYLNRNTEQFDDRQDQVGTGTQNSESSTAVGGLKFYFETVRETRTFALTTDVRQEELNTRDFFSGESYSATRQSLDATFQLSLYQFQDRLLLTPAIRATAFDDSFDGIQRTGDSSNSREKLTGRLGLSWQHNDRLTVNANVGQYHREPVFFELFGDRGFYLGSSDLVAEEGTNYDLGVRWQSTGKRARSLRVSWFGSSRDELIASVYDAQGVGRSENVGEARVYGVETAVTWPFSSRFNAQLNLTWQDTENRSIIRAYTGKQLPGQARWAGNLRLSYDSPRWKLWYETQLLRNRFYDAANVLPAEDVLQHNLGIGYQRPQFHTTLNLNNITDQNVEDFNGFPNPGRSVHLTFTYNFSNRG